MKSLQHLNDFEFDCEALGALRIGSLSAEARTRVQKLAWSADVNAADLAKEVFEQVAHLATGDKAVDDVCGGAFVAAGTAARLTGEELSTFAEEYGSRYFGTWQRQPPAEGQPRGVSYLVFQIRETNRAQPKYYEKLQAEIKRMQNSPFAKIMRDAERLQDLVNPPYLRAIQQSLEMKNPLDEMLKINSPFEDLHKKLAGVTGWKMLSDGLFKPNSAVEKFNSIVKADTAFTSAIKQLQVPDTWNTSLELARSIYAHQPLLDSITRTQRVFHDIRTHWELPRQLIDSVGALSALQEQIGRLTLPTLDWAAATELARMLGPAGLQAQLSALGIDENGELATSDETGEKRLFTPMGSDLFALLALVVTLLIFVYQESSSGKWQDSVDTKLNAQTALIQQQTSQLAALSVFVARAIEIEAKISSTRFVTLERGAIVYRHPESGAAPEGRLLPREVVTLISEDGKWIEVRYYHWASTEYLTGWVLKKYFTRVPPSRQNDGG